PYTAFAQIKILPANTSDLYGGSMNVCNVPGWELRIETSGLRWNVKLRVMKTQKGSHVFGYAFRNNLSTVILIKSINHYPIKFNRFFDHFRERLPWTVAEDL